MSDFNDPIGQAILDYSNQKNQESIIVESDICDDDIIPVPYLFREFSEMPEIEQTALNRAKGKVLDIGAGAGIHSKWLIEKGFNVLALDSSAGVIRYLQTHHIPAIHSTILDFESTEKFDTILLLMNGIGLAGNLISLPLFLDHLKDLLQPEGRILFDSSDIRYLYEEDDGSHWVNLNQAYFGEVQFQMKYKKHSSGWFNWLYVDFETIEKLAYDSGLQCNLIEEDQNNAYLAELKFRK